jgi:hypothetical protein
LVLGSWFLVLGSWFLVLGSWFLNKIPGLNPHNDRRCRLRFLPPLTARIPTDLLHGFTTSSFRASGRLGFWASGLLGFTDFWITASPLPSCSDLPLLASFKSSLSPLFGIPLFRFHFSSLFAFSFLPSIIFFSRCVLRKTLRPMRS